MSIHYFLTQFRFFVNFLTPSLLFFSKVQLDEHRGFNHLLGSVWASTEIAAAFDQMRRDMIEGITAVILGKAPRLSAAEALPCAQTLLHLIMGILPMIEMSSGVDRAIAIRELKRAWLAYLTAVIEESAITDSSASVA